MIPENIDEINLIIDRVIAKEQGFVDHPADRGGPTRWGITEFVARESGWRGEMKDFPVTLARKIYWKRYISEPRFDAVVDLNKAVGMEVIDTGVNMGPATAGIFLQRWLNGFNYAGQYQELFVDGRVGPATLDALQRFLRWRGKDSELALLRGLNSVQGSRYLGITENDSKQRQFLFGWIMHRVEIA